MKLNNALAALATHSDLINYMYTHVWWLTNNTTTCWVIHTVYKPLRGIHLRTFIILWDVLDTCLKSYHTGANLAG